MIKILEETEDDFVAIKVSEELTKNDLDVLNPVIKKTLKDHDSPKLYCEIHELDVPTAKAIFEKLKNIPDYKKFEKCALISARDWVEEMVKLADTTLNPEVRFYEKKEKKIALKWLQ